MEKSSRRKNDVLSYTGASRFRFKGCILSPLKAPLAVILDYYSILDIKLSQLNLIFLASFVRLNFVILHNPLFYIGINYAPSKY
jgi:hypothetical protein